MRLIRPDAHQTAAPRANNGAARRRGAFTIMELVIVVMVMGIMAAAATPAFVNSLVHHRVEAAAHRVKVDLELARHTARLTSTAQSIAFTGSTYVMSAGVKGFDLPSNAYVVDLADEPYKIGTVTADFNDSQTISFNGYGTPTSDGTVELKCNGHSAVLSLDPLTGEVTIVSTHTSGN